MIDRNTWIVSDTHIGHMNIVNYEKPRQNSMLEQGFELTNDDHNKWIVSNWNSVVQNDDLVLCLGDLAFKNFDVVEELKGRIHLIPGNHEYDYNAKSLKNLSTLDNVVSVQTGLSLNNEKVDLEINNKLLHAMIVDLDGQRIMFSHYPALQGEYKCRQYNSNEVNECIDYLNKFVFDYNVDVMIHGHTHSIVPLTKDKVDYDIINASWEPMGCIPHRLTEILNKEI